jgi:hypothetical protein
MSEETNQRERRDTEELARALGWTFFDLEDYKVSCGVLKRISAGLACRVRCVPVVFSRRRVVLAVDDPFNAAYMAANQQLLGPPYHFPLQFALATRRGIDAALHRRITSVRE